MLNNASKANSWTLCFQNKIIDMNTRVTTCNNTSRNAYMKKMYAIRTKILILLKHIQAVIAPLEMHRQNIAFYHITNTTSSVADFF